MLRNKKIIVVLAMVMAVFAFAGCSTKDGATDITENEPTQATEEAVTDGTDNVGESGGADYLVINDEPYCVTPADCDASGYKAIICDQTCELTFTAKNSGDVEWKVFLLEEQFGDDTRYISQANEPVLEGDGTIPVGENMYMYVFCSANEFTTGGEDGIPEGPVLEITRAE